jgi:glycosyltransferase involved in cell wall biosynthesis
MKNFIKYINLITKEPFINKTASRVTTILMPELDTTEGIYRSLLPAYILNFVDGYKVYVMGLTEKVEISHNQKDFHVSEKLIQETDHFVIPFVSYPIQQWVDDIREHKKDMFFSYYIDTNFYTMPDAYPFANEYKTAKMIETIEANIKAVDQVIVTNKSLKHYIADKLIEKYPDTKFNTNIAWQPLFILPELFKSDHVSKPKKGVVKMLIIGDEYQFSDINFIKGILKDIKVKYKDSSEIHILGFNGMKGDRNYLQDLTFIHHERVPFFRYYETILEIGPDLILIPANQNNFNNTSKNYIKYLEGAYLNIPVIAPNIKPYSEIIKTNENGFLCTKKEDYFMQIESFYTVREKFTRVPEFAYATATDYTITLDNNLNIIKSIYFPNYGKE